jgi:protein-S-isoprenylcysteine O-methyltransferase Ste14
MQFVKICWVVFVVYWIVSARHLKPVKERQSRASRLALLAWPIGMIVLVNVICRNPSANRWMVDRLWPDSDAAVLLGDAVTLAGLIFACWARTILGGNWSSMVTFKEGHELIERGPYQFVRHPIYTGLLVMVVGTAIVGGRGAYLLGGAATFVALLAKLRQEEALMTRHFPDTYPAYKQRTKMLIPFLF